MGIILTILLILLSVFVFFVLIFLFVKTDLVITVKKPRDGKLIRHVSLILPGDKVFYEKDYGKASREDEGKKYEFDSDQSITGAIDELQSTLRALGKTYSQMRHKLKKSVLMDKLSLKISFGLDDAFKTAMTAGAVWTGVFGIVAFVTSFITINEPDISVVPDFDEKYFEADLNINIKLRMITIIKVLYKYSTTKSKFSKKQVSPASQAQA